MTKVGCTMSPLSKKGNAYTFTADCKIQGVTAHSTSVMTVESDSAYSVRVETRAGSQQTVETLKARRTGDCTKQ